ncbi:SOUL family heme-binding protein [Aurantiacibacter sediminis]|uniref:Heme-binding protein n=1 Tax=Aurantiacibacter sediminis TaxID=2793064 RepID=A0ABS0N5F1_9SPHN|nr:heme-binding protein [Aurantiacibacter sediminis]MBH5323018.1 heme-binding protein [Aurantiacibacter sediminis]
MLKKIAIAAAGIGLLVGGSAFAYDRYMDSIEGPEYSVLQSDGDVELREYAPMVVAEVWSEGTREQASSRGFRRLAAYIFAQDRGGEEIAMTSPVLQDAGEPEQIAMTSPVIQDAGGEGRWRTRFVMPAEYTLETLPPAPDDITLTEVPARRMAVVQFSGNARNAELAEREEQLRGWMADNGLEAAGGAEYAFYDPPSVPGVMRRNEVMIPIE